MSRLRRKGLLALAVCAALLLLLATPVQASFHLMKIREVGQGGGGFTDHVVLQIYAGGQNLVAGKTIQTYDSAGAIEGTFTLPNNVPFGDDQRTIYIARADGTPPGTPDFISTDLVLTNAGAVCFGEAFGPGQAIDCVSYGAFPGVVGGAPSPMGTPAPAPAGGQAIVRSISTGCPTLLEASDDTDNSAADFAVGTPSLRGNTTAPTETICPITKRCRGKIATLVGTGGKDRLKGTPNRDVIVALGGRDRVNGGGGKDLICGQGGKDVLKGGAAKDTLVGGSGKDRLLGGKARDRLFGGGGEDKLFGQKGRDFCNGGSAKDKAKACERERRV